jgi:hypothetical protein
MGEPNANAYRVAQLPAYVAARPGEMPQAQIRRAPATSPWGSAFSLVAMKPC